MKRDPKSHTSSFRDPAGFVFEHGSKLYRQINEYGKADYEFMMSSGLYQDLTLAGLMVPHNEASGLKGLPSSDVRYKIIEPQRINFISYPYEWTFSQLKDAALLTLRIQKIALERGMILKDASAYNIQFIGKQPLFIDTLSFRIYKPGAVWDGYRQFCQHFLAPLALASYSSPEIIRSLRVFLDGLPLSLATSLLPARSRGRWGLLTHIFMHAASQKRYDKANLSPDSKTRKMSLTAMNGLVASLENTVKRMKLPARSTEWGEYYSNTNYSDKAFIDKKKVVKRMLESIKPTPSIVWDLGANDGTFSRLASGTGAYTVAFDIDYKAVEHNYRIEKSEPILPLIQDLSNPSPGLGWAHHERDSLEQRGPADVTLALALIHHLAIGNNTPLPQVAQFFASITNCLIIEFVPRGDSKVDILLRGRNQTFESYTQENFEKAFDKYFDLVEKKEVSDSQRIMYLYKVKK